MGELERMIPVLCLPSAVSLCFPVVWRVLGECSFPQGTPLVVSLKASVSWCGWNQDMADYRVETLVLSVIAAHFPNLCLE